MYTLGKIPFGKHALNNGSIAGEFANHGRDASQGATSIRIGEKMLKISMKALGGVWFSIESKISTYRKISGGSVNWCRLASPDDSMRSVIDHRIMASMVLLSKQRWAMKGGPVWRHEELSGLVKNSPVGACHG